MNTSTVLKVVGIALLCVGIHQGLASLAWITVFGCGMGFLFLP